MAYKVYPAEGMHTEEKFDEYKDARKKVIELSQEDRFGGKVYVVWDTRAGFFVALVYGGNGV